MSDETPWAHLQRLMAEQQPFEAALPGLQAHALTGEDMGVLLNHPTSDVVQWMRSGSVETTTPMTAVEPPADAPLPPRRTKSRGIFGWLSGVTTIEGLGHFTEADVFELGGVQFAVMPEPLRPLAYGEQVPMRVLALNCNYGTRELSVAMETEAGVLQGRRRHVLVLEPGVISLAVLPVRLCPTRSAVLDVFALFAVDERAGQRRWNFSARPYARPAQQVLGLVAGATAVAAAAGLTPLYLQAGAANQGSPAPLRLRADLKQPLIAPQQAPVLWRLMTVR